MMCSSSSSSSKLIKFMTVVEDDRKAHFSIATTPRGSIHVCAWVRR